MMLKQELIDIRKGVMEYQTSLNGKLNELIKPLELLNINWFGYGKFFLDEQQQCDNAFWIDSNLSAFNWYCMNAYDNGADFTKAIQNTPLNERNYFILPTSTDDYIIKAFHELYGLNFGITIYTRFNNYIEGITFGSTHQNSILSSNTLNFKTTETLSKYIKFFKSQLHNLNVDEKNVVKYTNTIDLSEQSFSTIDCSEFLNAIEIKKHPIEIGNKSIVLSKREWECLQILSQGKTIKEIASTLKVSPRTVESHLGHIKLKTGYQLKSDLVKIYQENSDDWR